MPLIIEDGTMPKGANSYVTLEQADAYLVPRNLWPVTQSNENDTDIEQPAEPVVPENPQPTAEETMNLLLSNLNGDLKINEDNDNSENPDNETGNEEDTEIEPELPDTSKPDDNPEIAKKETALMRAFDYLDTLKWVGQRVDWQRQIAWPRKNVPIPGCNPNNPEYIADNIIPDAVKKAQMELAALIYNGIDMFKPLERGGQYQQQSDSYSKGVDVLSKSESHSIAYASNAPKDTWLPSVYPLLRDFLDEVPGETNGFTVHNVLRG